MMPGSSLCACGPTCNLRQTECSATSVEVPITSPETAGSPVENHEERSWRYTVISASNKDMSHRGDQEMKQGVIGQHYSLPT